MADIITSDADIFQLPYLLVTNLGSQGALVDMQSYFPSLGDIFPEAVIKLTCVGDALYGVPWLGHSIQMVYNKDMTDKAGVNMEEITTFDELLAAFDAIEAANEGVKAFGMIGKQTGDVSWMSTPYIYDFGGSLVDADGKVVINSEAAKEGLNFYFNVLSKYGQNGWQEHAGGDVMEAFRTQRICCEMQGPWGVTDIWKQAKENQFTVGVMPMSQIINNGEPCKVEVSTYSFALMADSTQEEIDAAVDFINFMISKDAQAMLMDGEYSADYDAYYPFRVPVRSDMKDEAFFQEHPEFLAFIEGFANPGLESPIPEWAQIRTEYVLPGLNGIALGTMTIDDYLATVQEAAEKILK